MQWNSGLATINSPGKPSNANANDYAPSVAQADAILASFAGVNTELVVA